MPPVDAVSVLKNVSVELSQLGANGLGNQGNAATQTAQNPNSVAQAPDSIQTQTEDQKRAATLQLLEKMIMLLLAEQQQQGGAQSGGGSPSVGGAGNGGGGGGGNAMNALIAALGQAAGGGSAGGHGGFSGSGSGAGGIERGGGSGPVAGHAPPAGAQGSAVAQAAQSLYGMDTSSGPDGGNLACAWSVDKCLKAAGVPSLGDNPNYVPSVEAALRGGRGTEIAAGDVRPGDIAITGNGHHIGVAVKGEDGDIKILNNSSSKANFSNMDSLEHWNGRAEGGARYYRLNNT